MTHNFYGGEKKDEVQVQVVKKESPKFWRSRTCEAATGHVPSWTNRNAVTDRILSTRSHPRTKFDVDLHATCRFQIK